MHPVIVLREAVGGYFSTSRDFFFFPVILLFKHFTSSAERGGSQPPTGFARARGFLFARAPIILCLEEDEAASFSRR